MPVEQLVIVACQLYGTASPQAGADIIAEILVIHPVHLPVGSAVLIGLAYDLLLEDGREGCLQGLVRELHADASRTV